MAIVQATLTFLYWRMIIEVQYVTPIYLDYLRTQKAIKLPSQTKNLNKHEIIAPKSDWLDPYKEALAINEGIDGGWETITHCLKEQMNRELVDVVREQAEELLTYERIATEKEVDVKRLIEYSRRAGAEGKKALAAAAAHSVVAGMG